jgi:hypothetical protein
MRETADDPSLVEPVAVHASTEPATLFPPELIEPAGA